MMASTLVLFALGLVVGSFLNVCIHRLPRGQSIVTPPSQCPTCGSRVRWFDNVPVVSYLVLGGRCRVCAGSISVAYPLVELATGLLFVCHFWFLGWQPLLVPRLLFASAMVVLFVIDLQHRILPNVITLPGVVCGLLFSFVLAPGWLSSLLGVVIGGGGLLVIAEVYYRVRGEEGLGMGDVKMLAMIGAFLGWQPAILTLVLSSFIGSFVGVLLIVTKKGDMKYALPYGTFLAIAAVMSGLVGDSIIDWYLSSF